MEAIGERIFRVLRVRTLQEARSLPWQEVLDASIRTGDFRLMDSSVDGWFLPDLPENIFAAGRQHPVPFILCANLGEVTPGAATYVFPTLMAGYLNMLRGAKLAGVKGYACLFDQVPACWRSRGVSAIHAMELTYVFGDWMTPGRMGQHLGVGHKAAYPNREVPRDPDRPSPIGGLGGCNGLVDELRPERAP
jgi:carboxylesterase type B